MIKTLALTVIFTLKNFFYFVILIFIYIKMYKWGQYK